MTHKHSFRIYFGKEWNFFVQPYYRIITLNNDCIDYLMPRQNHKFSVQLFPYAPVRTTDTFFSKYWFGYSVREDCGVYRNYFGLGRLIRFSWNASWDDQYIWFDDDEQQKHFELSGLTFSKWVRKYKTKRHPPILPDYIVEANLAAGIK